MIIIKSTAQASLTINATLHVTHSIITNVTGSGPQMNDGSSQRTHVGKSVNVSHDIVTDTFLLHLGMRKVDIADVDLHLTQLLVCNSEAQFLQTNNVLIIIVSIITIIN